MRCNVTAFFFTSKNDGHPVPESNFIFDVYSSLSQPAQVYTPVRFSPLSALENGNSVFDWRKTPYAGGLSRAFQSSSLRSMKVVEVDVREASAIALLGGGMMMEEKPREKMARKRRRTVRRVVEIGLKELSVVAEVGGVVVVEPFGSVLAAELSSLDDDDDVLHEIVCVRKDVRNALFNGLS